jgi:hypothetical protein
MKCGENTKDNIGIRHRVKEASTVPNTMQMDCEFISKQITEREGSESSEGI